MDATNKPPRFQVVEQTNIFVVDTHHPDYRESTERVRSFSHPWIVAYWCTERHPGEKWHLPWWKKDRAKSLARMLNEWHELTKGESG